MRFIIDGIEWNYPHMESLSREEQLESVYEYVGNQGRLIVDMLCDGESLDEKDLLTVPDAIDLEISTNTPYGLGLEILSELRDSLSEIFKNLRSSLEASEEAENEMLAGARENLNWVCDVTDSFRDAYPDYSGRLPDAHPVADAVSDYEGMLRAGDYADAENWIDHEWVHHILPPFMKDLKEFKDWLEAMDEEPVELKDGDLPEVLE